MTGAHHVDDRLAPLLIFSGSGEYSGRFFWSQLNLMSPISEEGVMVLLVRRQHTVMLDFGLQIGKHCLTRDIPRGCCPLAFYRITDLLFFSTNNPVIMNEAYDISLNK